MQHPRAVRPAPRQALRDMIVRHPALLLYSIETVIKPKVSALTTALNVTAVDITDGNHGAFPKLRS